MTSAPENGIIAGINITPLVDVSLVLLIIFIVTAKLVVAPAVPLELPRATRTQEMQVVFSVAVPVAGPIVANGTALGDESQLTGLARDALRRQPDLRVVIHADGGVPHRRVIQVIDRLERAGVTRIAFAALPAAESGD
jgi:biopolymer transport protein TolR